MARDPFHDPLLPGPRTVSDEDVTEPNFVVAQLDPSERPSHDVSAAQDAKNLWARLVEQISAQDSEAEVLVTIHSFIANAERRGMIRGAANQEIAPLLPPPLPSDRPEIRTSYVGVLPEE